jgi:antirestriction protein ArdC
LRYSEREIDFAYLAGVFNVSGIDGLQKEIERLKGLGKNPHDIIIAAREQ